MSAGGRGKRQAAPAAPLAAVGVPPTVRRIRLKTVSQVGDELARVYRAIRSGTMDPATGTKLAFVLSVLARLRESGDLEHRIEQLEAASENP